MENLSKCQFNNHTGAYSYVKTKNHHDLPIIEFNRYGP